MWDDACVNARICPTGRGISEMDCSSTCDVRVTGAAIRSRRMGVCLFWGVSLTVWGLGGVVGCCGARR